MTPASRIQNRTAPSYGVSGTHAAVLIRTRSHGRLAIELLLLAPPVEGVDPEAMQPTTLAGYRIREPL